MQDELALAKARRGDADAFEQLVTPYERRLYNLCLRMMGTQDDAQDALQETMLKLWRGLASFDARSQFGTWAYRIATNVCLDALRKKQHRPQTSLDALAAAGFVPEDPSPTPEESMVADARAEAVRQALGQLAADARAALVLRDIQGETYEAAAEALGLPLGTVKSRIYRAREKIATLLSRNSELFPKDCVQDGERRRS